MKYTFKIKTKDDPDWNKNLVNSKYATYFQTTYYLNSNSNNFFPVFISIIDESNSVVGQIGISIIKTSVLYSSTSFQKILKLITNITKRGIWLFGPIIYSDIEEEKLKILEQIIIAIDIVCNKYDLVFIEGYTSPYNNLINDDCLLLFVKNKYIFSEHITFITDLSKPIDQIFQNISKKTRGDIKRAQQRNFIVKELETIDELKEFLLLHNTWAKTKGLEISNPFKEQEKLWNNHKLGVEKFFLAYKDNKLISGLRLSCFNDIVYTHFVINSYFESTNLGGTLLTWTAINWAKNMGFKFYDFSGGPKSNLQNKDSLMFYKKKWGGNHYSHYNVIKIHKKLNYFLYKFLFNLVRIYHNFKSKQKKP